MFASVRYDRGSACVVWTNESIRTQQLRKMSDENAAFLFTRDLMVPMEGVEPTHSYEYQILSLARLPIPPHRLSGAMEYKLDTPEVNTFPEIE